VAEDQQEVENKEVVFDIASLMSSRSGPCNIQSVGKHTIEIRRTTNLGEEIRSQLVSED
jgi:hypothetical protein